MDAHTHAGAHDPTDAHLDTDAYSRYRGHGGGQDRGSPDRHRGRQTHGVRSAYTAKAHTHTHAHPDAYAHIYTYTYTHVRVAAASGHVVRRNPGGLPVG